MPLPFRTVHKEFSAAAWPTPAAVQEFARNARGLPAGDLAKLVPLLAPDASTPPNLRRARMEAFVLLADGSADSRLFSALFRLCAYGDEATRRVLTPVLARAAEPKNHVEIARLLAEPDAALRRFGATVLKAVGGRTALLALGSLLRESSSVPRSEAIELIMEIGGHHAIEFVAPLVSEGSQKERLLAVQLLGDPRFVRASKRAALEALAPALSDESSPVVAQAIRSYGALAPEDEFFDMVGEYFQGQDQRLQLVAVQALGTFTSPRAVRELDRLYRLGGPAVREGALRALQQIASEDVLPTLVAALGDAVLALRNIALDVVVDLGRSQKVELGRMLLWLLRSPDVNVRRQAVEIVRAVGDPHGELWPRLLRLLRDEDWWVRERVVDALVEIAGVELTRHVVAYLQDENDVIRRYAVEVLMRVKDPRALGALVRTASEDKDWWVRERAVECMAEIGDARVVPHIVKLAEEDKSLLFVAIQALGKLKHGDGLRLLCRAVRHEDAEYRLEALASLAMVNDASADPYVRPLLEDTDARVRLEATQLLSSWEGRAVSGGGADVVERLTGLERLLWRMTQKSGDDLFIISGRPPHMKTMNQVLPLSDRALTPEQVEATLSAVMTPLQIRAIQEGRDVDFSMEVKSQGLRFRVNVFQQLTGWTGVFRRIVNEIHNFDELGLPPLVKTLADLPHGLVLIGGPTGSGKSTTLAAMIDHLNRFYGRHIITIEDPIEVAHGNKRSIVTQREVGSHTTHFGAALRSTLREDPDVILVGEMRDLDTIGFAVSAAETGHLVLGTVHTVSADTAVDRLIDAFPPRQHQQVRAMISQTLRAVVCQQLLRRRDGRGRVPAVEILLNTDAVANIIRRGQCFQLPSVVATSREMGMQSMDLELMRLCRAGLVDAEEAYVKSVSKKEFEAFLSELRAAEQAAAVGGTRRAAN